MQLTDGIVFDNVNGEFPTENMKKVVVFILEIKMVLVVIHILLKLLSLYVVFAFVKH
jgi:hypothetical protein